ncbi:GMC family oxidoreductase [Mesorhizobium sp. CO1-1-8]|uniref:GMC family oxidoreductase n=1 Tax=Mesorhizobium sp. CO1-1-8 TaxID=2876631 RepID=UPI001CD17ED6|nr:GMC family oxidoreductase [Mesorhizobium sp. CO1-1-8]MBZ9772248.1 GMC family oxidoreductase [Mesorhizobium sp. CO1-1-8]
MSATMDSACDVLIIGSGASGSLSALVLAQAGLDVLCLEQGNWVDTKERAHERPDWAWQRQDTWNPDVNSRSNTDDYRVDTNASHVLMWNGVGGSTNVYGAIWPRYRPSDFRKGDEHGLQPNWPISYEDLAPFYERVDRLLGVSGLAGDPAMPPREQFPTKPLPFSRSAQKLSKAFDRLGWHWWPAEAAVISEDYDGRPGCNSCGLCFGCSRGSMSLFSQSVWPKALRAGARLQTNARVLRIEIGRDGRATGVVWKDRISGREERTRANVILLGANGVGTPRLLLTSDNLANSSGMVGRNLLHHTLVSAQIQVEEQVDGHVGHIASLISREFAETDLSRGFVNGFNFNCLTSSPSAAELSNGWLGGSAAPWGKGHHQWFEKNFGHSITLLAMGDDLPNPENRVYLDDAVTDADGIPVTRVNYAPGENDRRMMNFGLDRLVDIGRAANAITIELNDYRDTQGVYRTPAWHLLGTCRMGDDPEMSVVNRWNQAWDVPNLFIVDGSTLATGGVVNPTPTVSALALRAAEYVRDNYLELSRTTRSAVT